VALSCQIENRRRSNKGEHKAPAYLQLTHAAKVPTLKDGDLIIYESVAIMSYLDRKYPDPPLFGETLEETSLIRRALEECESYVVSADDKVVRPILFGKGLDKSSVNCGRRPQMLHGAGLLQRGQVTVLQPSRLPMRMNIAAPRMRAKSSHTC
jgi:glutathione S-transferase